MGLGIVGDAFDAAGDAVDKAADIAGDVAGEVGDAVVKVGETAYNVSKEFADKVAEMAKYVMGFTDEAVEKVIKLLNLPWPEADEGRMRELAAAYTVMADALDSVTAATWKQAASVTANNKGLPIDNFAAFWKLYDAGGGAGWLHDSVKACRSQATFLNENARLVGEAKDKMRTEILAVAATILAGVGLSIATAGAASGAAASASAAVVSACGAAAGTLTAAIVTAAVTAGVFAIQGALVAVVVDLAVTQPVRLAGGAQESLSLDQAAKAAMYGGAGGAAGSTASTVVSQLPKLAPALETVSPMLAATTRNAPKVFTSVPGQTVVGAGGAALFDTATGQPISLASLTFGAAGGAAGAKAAKAVPAPTGPKGAPVDPAEANLTGRPPNAERVAGDPVEVVAGKMIIPQCDFTLPGVLPLVMTRKHLSSYRHGRWFGRSWASWLDQHLELSDGQVVFTDDNGLILHFPVPEAGTRVFPTAGPQLALAWDGTAGGAFAVADQRSGIVRYFAAPTRDAPTTGRDGLILPLVAVADRNGNQIDIVYDPDSAPVEVWHSGGYRVGIDTAGGRVTRLRLLDTDPGTHARDESHPDGVELVRYAYTDDGDLAEVYNSSGKPLTFTYDTAGRVTSWTDRIGMSSAYTYDTTGRCTRTTGKDGVLDTRFEYNTTERTTTVINSLGQRTIYHYNAAYQITSETDPLGHTTQNEWGNRNELLASTDPLGHATRWTYDDHGNPTEVLLADGTTTTALCDDAGNPLRVTGPDGATWTYEYDEHRNLTAAIDPSGARTEYTRDAWGRAVAVTDALGGTRRFVYDTAGMPVEATDPLGACTRITRDAFGRPVHVTDPLGRSTTAAWTVEGHPIRREHAGGAEEQWTYDAEGNVTAYHDPADGLTRFEVTDFDKVASRTDQNGTRYAFGYDSELRLTTVTNPHGQAWTYTYDAAGRLVAERDFNGRELTYRLDPVGRVAARVNGAAEQVEYRRDALGRPVRQIHTATGRTTTYAYDAVGRLSHTANPDVSLTFERDVLGRITAEISNGSRLTNGYDALGRRTRRETPSGHISTWTYDAAGNPLTLDSAGRQVAFAHDALGRETGRRFGENITLTQEWDLSGRLATQTLAQGAPVATITAALSPDLGAQRLHRRTYKYRSDGYPVAVTDTHTGTTAYDLDSTGRVTAVHAEGWTERYAYDALGNVTRAEWPAAAGSTGEDVQGERHFTGTLVRSAGRTRYVHDAQGRLVRKTRRTLSGKLKTWSYVWDPDDRLIAVTTPDRQCLEYRYDPLARRTERLSSTDEAHAATDVGYAWDGLRLVAATNAAGTETTWEYDGWRVLTETSRSSHASEPTSAAGGFTVIIADAVGTPITHVDDTGTRIQHRRRSLWGEELHLSDTADGLAIGFPGQIHDDASALTYSLFRYYNTETASFVSPDPLGLSAAPNHHSYVRNPTTAMDVLGLAPVNYGDGNGPGSYAQGYDGDGMMLANLTEEGTLTMAVEKGQSTVSGGQMFKDVMTYFGPANVRVFEAKWTMGMPTNLDAFNANLRAGMTLEQAASQTFTGHMLGKYGLTEVSFLSLKGEHGNYTNVEPVFSKPGG